MKNGKRCFQHQFCFHDATYSSRRYTAENFYKNTSMRAIINICKQKQASTNVIFPSNSSKIRILQKLLNRMGLFNTPQILSFKESDNALNQFQRSLFHHVINNFNIINFRIIDITRQQCLVFNKFLLLVKVCALHSQQLLACLSKHLISIAVYDRIAQRIQR